MKLTILFGLLVLVMVNGYAVDTLASVSLDRKIGQMVMVGFKGTELKPTDPIVQDILAQRIGGVVLYAKDFQTKQVRNIQNPEQLKKLTQQLQGYALQAANNHHNQLYPLLIAVDYEGGKIVNLNPENGFPVVASAAAIARESPQAAKQWAQQMAVTLRQVGINMDLAPVVDVNANPDNPIIAKYGRSFSADPNQVVLYAAIFSRTLQAEHILCVYKHFPGHGSSTQDSHAGLVDITPTWSPLELIPYRQLLHQPAGCNVVMIGHLVNHQLDRAEYPASLSYAMTTELLRQQVGFKGVIITDDLQMGAITSYYATAKAVQLAINAGANILMFSNQLVKTPQNTAQLIQVIQQQVQAGKISIQSVDQSNERISQLKQVLKANYSSM